MEESNNHTAEKDSVSVEVSPEKEIHTKKPRIPRHFLLIGLGMLVVFLIGISVTVQSMQKQAVKSSPSPTVSPTNVPPTATPTLIPTAIPTVARAKVPVLTPTPLATPTTSITPTVGPMGFTFDNTNPKVGIVKGGCVDAFVFTSKGSTSWHFSPMTFYPDNTIYWEKTSGTATNGEMIKQRICAKADFPYSSPGGGAGGPTTFYDGTTNATQQINVNVTF